MEHRNIEEIEADIADLQGRWPAHSVKPIFWQRLEELEEELARAEAAEKEKNK